MSDFSPNQINISSESFTGNITKQSQSPVFTSNSLDTLNTTSQAQQSNIDTTKRFNAPTPAKNADAIQQVFSKSPVTKKNGHELRNSNHKAFLQFNIDICYDHKRYKKHTRLQRSNQCHHTMGKVFVPDICRWG